MDETHEKGDNKIDTNAQLSYVESNRTQNLRYPKRVFLILGNEFCERFMYYGLDTILVFYLRDMLHYSDNDSTLMYHSFTMSVYFMCIFGGILSDVWLGKFRTIFILSIIYAIGCFVISISAVPSAPILMSPKAALIIGLLLVAIGSGGIKPCVSAFGGDQFKLPEQAAQLATFFSVFYFSINFGSLISTALTPVLRANVHCFGDDTCYSLAFGVPAVLMIVSVVFFLMGKTSYTYSRMTSENQLIQVSKCISNAIGKKFSEGRSNPRDNLLDYSIEKYGEELVNDTRTLLQILILYLPLPLFWTLYDQKGSRWSFQASEMNGDIGFYVLLPDQMQMVNPLLVLVLIPLFEMLVYPAMNKIGLGRPLQKIAIGGLLAALSFFMSAAIQFWIDLSPEKSVHLLWQLPQYFVLTIGETMLSPTGLAFSYDQAPESMKSVVQSFWHLTVAFGNLITVVFVGNVKVFPSVKYEFIFFGCFMVVDMFLFMVLAYFYKSVKRRN